jgi:preprotein translocase subunit SecF
MLDIIGKRFWFFTIFIAMLFISIISLAVFSLKTGIEFSSGSLMRVRFEQTVGQGDLKKELTSLGYGSALIQRTGEGDFLIRTGGLTGEDKPKLESALAAKFGRLAVAEFSNVSPLVAQETAQNAVIAVVIASIGILLYVTWAFRRMPKPFRYGTSAVITLAHDALVALGVFSILGAVLGWEINLMFITGILAIIGYSVNNIVVVFDRIRENLIIGVSPDFEVIVNNSMIETLGRSLNTSLTTLFAVWAILLFVGASIQNFAVVLMIGIIVGTFSSVCIAPTLLVVWEKGEWGKLFRWGAKAKGG